jgi:hypothetical protein
VRVPGSILQFKLAPMKTLLVIYWMATFVVRRLKLFFKGRPPGVFSSAVSSFEKTSSVL